ncbi:MAG: sulfatase-like hydrolase/transferase, partial [Verrucomicrobiota bacterium]|nr:sulfatase-like hydrolase/transferase [Verrucomicrobiota bacterium]
MYPRAFTFTLALCSHFVGAKTHQTPNIVLFMVDDMGIGDCSAYLGLKLMPSSSPITQTLKTPNIEEFAQDGMIFTDAHAPASMCSSTRYSLLTGRLSHRSYLKN